MKRRDEGKATLVDFLRSINFSTRREKRFEKDEQCNTHFAALTPHARPGQVKNNEDDSLERSAN